LPFGVGRHFLKFLCAYARFWRSHRLVDAQIAPLMPRVPLCLEGDQALIASHGGQSLNAEREQDADRQEDASPARRPNTQAIRQV
jgi:hypothetical protein